MGWAAKEAVRGVEVTVEGARVGVARVVEVMVVVVKVVVAMVEGEKVAVERVVAAMVEVTAVHLPSLLGVIRSLQAQSTSRANEGTERGTRVAMTIRRRSGA